MWVVDSGGPREPFLMGVHIPHERCNFEGKRDVHCIVSGHCVTNCAKSAESVQMLFGMGMWTGIRSNEACIRWGAHCCHLANAVEPSMHGGDAAFCQIMLTTC